MSSDYSNFSKQIRIDINQIKSESKSIKKDASTKLDLASKELDKKIKYCKERAVANANAKKSAESNIFRRKLETLQAAKRELKNIKAELATTKDHNSEKIIEIASRAVTKIEDIKKNEVGQNFKISVDLTSLNQKIEGLNTTVAQKVNGLFASFKTELEIQKKHQENAGAVELLDNAVHHLGSSILMPNQPEKQMNLTEATEKLEQAANHALLLEAQKPLNEVREKLLEKRAAINQVPKEQLPEKDKSKLLAGIDQQLEEISGLNLSLLKGNVSNKEASILQSQILKLTKNTEKTIDNLGKQPPIAISETKLLLKKSIENLQMAKTDIQNLKKHETIKQKRTQELDAQIKSLQGHLDKTPELSNKEVSLFRSDAEKLVNPSKTFLDELSLEVVQAQYSFSINETRTQYSSLIDETRNRIDAFKRRTDIPDKIFSQAKKDIEDLSLELQQLGLDKILLTNEPQTLEQLKKSLSNLQSICSEQNEVIKAANIAAKDAETAARKSIQENLGKARGLLGLVTEKTKGLAPLHRNESIKQELNILEKQISELIVPKENTLEAAEAFAEQVRTVEDKVTRKLDTLFNVDLLNEQEFSDLEPGVLIQQTQALQEQTGKLLGELQGYSTGRVQEHFGRTGSTQLKEMDIEYQYLISKMKKESGSPKDLQRNLSDMQSLHDSAVKFHQNFLGVASAPEPDLPEEAASAPEPNLQEKVESASELNLPEEVEEDVGLDMPPIVDMHLTPHDLEVLRQGTATYQENAGTKLKEYLQAPDHLENSEEGQPLIKNEEVVKVVGEQGLAKLTKMVDDYKTFSQALKKEESSPAEVLQNYKNMKNLSDRVNKFQGKYLVGQFNVMQDLRQTQQLPLVKQETRRLQDETGNLLSLSKLLLLEDLETRAYPYIDKTTIKDVLGKEASKDFKNMIQEYKKLKKLISADENSSPETVRENLEAMQDLNEDVVEFLQEFQEAENIKAIISLGADRYLKEIDANEPQNAAVNSSEELEKIEKSDSYESLTQEIRTMHEQAGNTLRTYLKESDSKAGDKLSINEPLIQKAFGIVGLNKFKQIIADYTTLQKLLDDENNSFETLQEISEAMAGLSKRIVIFDQKYQQFAE